MRDLIVVLIFHVVPCSLPSAYVGALLWVWIG